MVSDDRGSQILAIAIAFIILYTLSLVLRIVTRVKILGNAFGPDDTSMLISYFLFLAYVIAQLVGVHHGTGKKRYLIDDENAQLALRSWFFCYIFYTLASCALKISIGLFLLRIAAHRYHIFIIKLIIVANIVFAIPYCLVVIFQCQPVSFWWDLNPSHHGKCLSPHVMVIMGYTISVLNSIADWTYGILPFFIVKDLQMARQTKILVASILGFAALGSTATIVRTPFVNALAHYKGEFLWKTTDIAIWTTIELGVGATAANTATLRPLISRIRRHLRGGMSSTAGGSQPLPSFVNRGATRTNHARHDVETLVAMDELRGHNGGKTSITIQGGRGGEEEVGFVTEAWKDGGIVQSVEIKTERCSRDERRRRSELEMAGRRDQSNSTVAVCEGEEMGRAILPYERL